jgi:hypothetical protein
MMSSAYDMIARGLATTLRVPYRKRHGIEEAHLLEIRELRDHVSVHGFYEFCFWFFIGQS